MGNKDSKFKEKIPYMESLDYMDTRTNESSNLPALLIKINQACSDKYYLYYKDKLLIKYLNDLYPFESMVSNHGYLSKTGQYVTFSKFAFDNLMPGASHIYEAHPDYSNDNTVKYVLVYPPGCISVAKYLKSLKSEDFSIISKILPKFHRQIMAQLRTMHSFNIIHADVCLDNIGISNPSDSIDPSDWNFYLFDFDFSFNYTKENGWRYVHENERFERILSWRDDYHVKYITPKSELEFNLIDYEMLLWTEMKLVGLFPVQLEMRDEHHDSIYIWKINLLLFGNLISYSVIENNTVKLIPYPPEIQELLQRCRYDRNGM